MDVDKEGEAKENLPLRRASSMHTLSDFVPGTSMPRQADGRTAFERETDTVVSMSAKSCVTPFSYNHVEMKQLHETCRPMTTTKKFTSQKY